MTTTQNVSISARRLVAYLDADETADHLEGSPVCANRPHLQKLVDDLRLAIAAEEIEVER